MKIIGKGLQVGDVGYPLVVTYTELNGDEKDLSDVTEILFFIKHPTTGVVLEVEGEFDSDGVDGKVKYLTEAGDISAEGLHQIQAKVTAPSFVLHSDVQYIYAYPNLENVGGLGG